MIDENESFLISSHVRPDADALGSELGMRAILLGLGKKVCIVNASAPPSNLHFMNPPGVILKLNDTVTKATIPQHDVVIIVDTSAWQQLGSMSEYIQSSEAKRVVIDHHVSSDDLNALELKDVTSAATGELICEIAEEFGVTFDADVANWLYAAIATDTGWFRFPSTSARTMKITAKLMDLGRNSARSLQSCPRTIIRCPRAFGWPRVGRVRRLKPKDVLCGSTLTVRIWPKPKLPPPILKG